MLTLSATFRNADRAKRGPIALTETKLVHAGNSGGDAVLYDALHNPVDKRIALVRHSLARTKSRCNTFSWDQGPRALSVFILEAVSNWLDNANRSARSAADSAPFTFTYSGNAAHTLAETVRKEPKWKTAIFGFDCNGAPLFDTLIFCQRSNTHRHSASLNVELLHPKDIEIKWESEVLSGPFRRRDNNVTAADLDRLRKLIDALNVCFGATEEMPQQPRLPQAWEDYQRLYRMDEYRVAYIPLINQVSEEKKKVILSLKYEDVALCRDEPYQLPATLRRAAIAIPSFSDVASCRLAAYSLDQDVPRLNVTLSETKYSDYLRASDNLDAYMEGHPDVTYREHYAGELQLCRVPFSLPNICGVGVVLVTTGEWIIVSKHSPRSHVYPGRLTFAASGTMKWGVHPHPFVEVSRKCFEEIRHQIDLRVLRLVGFGVDARKLYYQFSFSEKTNASVDEIQRFASAASSTDEVRLESLPFDLDIIVQRLIDECWEPAAEVTLLTLCAERYGWDQVSAALRKRRDHWVRRAMLDEWDFRATRQGDIADMSTRYPKDSIDRLSRDYQTAVMEFIGDEINCRRVLEIGAGTGRITQHLISRAGHVTCVELCPLRIERLKERLRSVQPQCPNTVDLRGAEYICGLAQEYRPECRFDAVICSLVLIHNVGDDSFRELIAALKRCADTLFVFEDISPREKTGPHTRLRSEAELLDAFTRAGFEVQRRAHEMVHGDQIVFLKLERRTEK
jgi:SAM-dependent methyltransferase